MCRLDLVAGQYKSGLHKLVWRLHMHACFRYVCIHLQYLMRMSVWNGGAQLHAFQAASSASKNGGTQASCRLQCKHFQQHMPHGAEQ